MQETVEPSVKSWFGETVESGHRKVNFKDHDLEEARKQNDPMGTLKTMKANELEDVREEKLLHAQEVSCSRIVFIPSIT